MYIMPPTYLQTNNIINVYKYKMLFWFDAVSHNEAWNIFEYNRNSDAIQIVGAHCRGADSSQIILFLGSCG